MLIEGAATTAPSACRPILSGDEGTDVVEEPLASGQPVAPEQQPTPEQPPSARRRDRDAGELVLATLVAGGATWIVFAAPSIIEASGSGAMEAQLTYLLSQIVGVGVFVIAALLALLVYGLGVPWISHAVLAAITASVLGAAILVVGHTRVSFIVSGVVAIPAVFLSLWAAVAARRRASHSRSGHWMPRIPLALTAVLAGLAAGATAVLQGVVANFQVLTDPSPGDFPEVIAPWILVGGLVAALPVTSLVVVVLLVDRQQAPRGVPAIIVGVLTPFLVPQPLFVISGIHDVGETLAWGAVAGCLVAIVVFWAGRRAAAAPTGDEDADQPRATEVGEPA